MLRAPATNNTISAISPPKKIQGFDNSSSEFYVYAEFVE